MPLRVSSARTLAALLAAIAALNDGSSLAAQLDVREEPLGIPPNGNLTRTLSISAAMRIGYVTSTPAGDAVVIDGVQRPFFSHIYQSAGPTPITFSPDGKRFAYLAQLGDSMVFVVDDDPGALFESVILGSWTFSSDSRHIAYIAKRNGKPIVVHDETLGPEYDAIDDLAYSADSRHLVYRGRRNGRTFAVVDDQEVAEGDVMRSLLCSDSCEHLAYTVWKRGGRAMVIDGVEGRTFRTVGIERHFSPDGRRFLYVARDSLQYVVVDGVVSRGYSGILEGSAQFSADGRHVAFAVADEGGVFWVLDGREQKRYDQITFSPRGAFSADGTQLTYAATLGNGWFVVIGTKEGERFDHIYDAPYFGGNGHVAYRASRGNLQFAGVDTSAFAFDRVVGVQLLSRSVAFEVSRSGRWHFFTDGALSPGYPDEIGPVVESADGKRSAYLANRGVKRFYVLDGIEQRHYDELWAGGFSPDGRHFAYAGRRDSQWHIVVDGKESPAYFQVESFPFNDLTSDESFTVLAIRSDLTWVRVTVPWPRHQREGP